MRGAVTACLLGGLFVARAQQAEIAQSRIGRAKPSPARMVGDAERGPHWQRVQEVVPVEYAQGNLQYRTNRYTQLEQGLNYLSDQGTWEPSSIDIEPAVGGGATAWKGQHKVSFSGQLNVGNAIQMRLPEGPLLVSHVQGLAYYDAATGQSVLFAEVKDSDAWLYPPNQILYPDAFSNVEADVRYTYTKAGLEQDIILREAPPAPEKYGLNSATTRLEVWTEFVQPPEPKSQAKTLNEATVTKGADLLVDETLEFGSMRLGTGKTFFVGEEDESLALVAKQWVSDGDRRFLVEAVQVPAVAESLQDLPPAKGGGASVRPSAHNRLQVMHSLPVKAARKDRGQQAKKMTTEKLVALNRRPGLVLDYSAITTNSLSNYTFRSDTTYYVSGLLTLGGTNNTFEGGTVIKFANTNTPKIVVNTPLTWLGDFYRPVVFTAKDDSSVGEQVATNALSGYYADTALDLEAGTANTNYTLGHLRIAYAKKAIVLNQKTGHVLSHVQLVNCQNGINPTSADFSLRNALFYNVLTNFNGSSSTNRIEHLTVDGANWFNYNGTFNQTNLTVLNSLLIAVTNAGSYTPNVVQTNTASGVFQGVGGGNHYLAASSPYRNAGNTGINVALSKDFQRCTTYPPSVLSTPVTISTTLNPQALRDTDTPDLGYHYPTLDYYNSFPITVTNATLTLTNGVTLGFSGLSAFWLQSRGALVSGGLAQQLNTVAPYSAVQESAASGTPAPVDTLINNYTGSDPFSIAPTIDLKFTALYVNTPGRYTFYGGIGSGFQIASLKIRDSQLYGGGGIYYGVGDTNAPSVVLQFSNNLNLRTFYDLEGLMQVAMYNQLAVNAAYALLPGATNNSWAVKDNAFDNTDVFADTPPGFVYSNNAYFRTNGWEHLTPLQTNDIVLSAFTYASVTNGLGAWYHGLTSLVNKGSRNATNAALYHYTTQTDQTKETNSVVDIGFHYVAVDGSGNPLDADGDGIPDYLEDKNGNGSGTDSGETDWQTSNGVGGGSNVLVIFTPLQ